MKIAVIGSSHVAAFRLGTPEDADITYFAAAAGSTRTLEVKDGSLVSSSDRVRRALARTSRGKSDITAADFDGFAIVGLVDLVGVASLGLTHRTFKHVADVKVALISEACQKAVVHSLVTRRSLAAMTLDKLRTITDAPIVVVPCPLPSTDILTNRRHGRMWRTPGLVKDTMAVYDEALAALPATIVRQPSSTVEGDIFTRTEFARGSIMLRETTDAHPDDESFHMNRDFGAIMVREMLAALTRPARGSSPRP